MAVPDRVSVNPVSSKIPTINIEGPPSSGTSSCRPHLLAQLIFIRALTSSDPIDSHFRWITLWTILFSQAISPVPKARSINLPIY